jgi:amidophosphoribosyltransferase
MRGDAKKLKVMESAREAVRQGTAGEEEVRMAAGGVKVDQQGNVVPANQGNQAQAEAASKVAAEGEDEEKRPKGGLVHRGSQDVSLHNFNDY